MVIEALRRFFVTNDIGACRIVVACSGGVDSTALLVAMTELDFDVMCGHVNHHLRGDESNEDEAFVRAMCEQFEIAIEVADGTLSDADVKRAGIEAAAREVRTRSLLEIKRRHDAKYIATAHQKNDQAETVLMRLFTGSGLAGLRAIHPIREDGFIRPLLGATRAEIESFLREHNVTPRIDSTNVDPRFLRNRIRATLREYEPSVIDNLAAIADQARAQWPLIERVIDDAANVDTTES